MAKRVSAVKPENGIPEDLQRSLVLPGTERIERRIETHLSYLILTQSFVYKLKKRIRLDFVDFSTLALREFYCREELRLNSVFAPHLYLSVVPVVRLSDGRLQIDPEARNGSDDGSFSECDVIEWAVKMRRFDEDAQADQLVEAGLLEPPLFATFGGELANQHERLPVALEVPDITAAILENFATIASTGLDADYRERLASLAAQANQEVNTRLAQIGGRADATRECHGDLHLSNMILQQGRLQAFDCLEFNSALRTIDVWNDVAFLFMDCCVRDRQDLAYAFVDGYLGASGDFAGLELLPLYARYRSMVRAKVAALAFDQHTDEKSRNASRTRFLAHLHWSEEQLQRGPGRLVITCGLSGSGKSFWAAQLVASLGAIRLRSDVLRKSMEGLAPDTETNPGLGEALYSPARSNDVYQELARLAGALLEAGECVIVDATCLYRSQRDLFASLADSIGSSYVVLHMTAPEATLRDRIRGRTAKRDDPSEATGEVLDWQLQHQEPPQHDESALEIDTVATDLQQLVEQVRLYFTR